MHDHLVLICPACQACADWTADLELCAKCRSAHLIRRLGQVECLDCGLVREPEARPDPGLSSGLELGSLVPSGAADRGAADRGLADRGLADEVSRALDRLLGRS
jgi:hypothetical protein